MTKNKQIIFVFILLLFGISNVNAQRITLNISGHEGNAKFFSLEGEKIILIDSSNSDNGKIILQSDKYELHTGFYRMIISKNTCIDFIKDNEDVEISTDIKNVTESLSVVKSNSNKLFHQFIRLNKAYKTKTELLQYILSRYPTDDDFYTTAQKKFEELQKEYFEFVNVTSQVYPKSFVARYIKSAQLPVVSSDITPQNQLAYLQSNALENIDFSDATLIHSDLFTNKSIEYLTYSRNPQLPKELLEKEFMKATDTLLTRAKVNDLVYQHITEYLISGFKQFGFDNIIDYIIQKYVVEDEICLDEKLGNSIQRRIDQSKNLAVGIHAPNFKIPDADGNTINLAEINSEKTLLVFYASWCPHCKTLLPEISEFYKNQKEKNLEVIAISLDENKTDWLKFVDENEINCINVSDGLEWDGKASSYYSIYATPTMFLLDKEKKIIGKPMNVVEFKSFL